MGGLCLALQIACMASAQDLLAESPPVTKSALGNPTLSAKMEELAQQEARLIKEISGQVQGQSSSKLKERETDRLPAATERAAPSGAIGAIMEPVGEQEPSPRSISEEKPTKISNSDQTSSDLLMSIQNTNLSLTKKLKEKEQRVDVLEHELDQLRNRLIVAETERERLSKQLDSSHYQNIVGGSSALRLQQQVQPPARKAAVQPARNLPAPQPVAEPDLPIVTVTADKAALRTGPGLENSPLLHVSKGTTLTVETRNGNWYRVNTPQGTRAWISGDIVKFGKENSQLKNSAVDTTLDDRAYEALRNSDAR